MLAVRKVARGVGNVELREVPTPAAGPGQVVIEVAAAGICGTDVHIYLDEFATAPPVTIGHEFAGQIVEVGPEVKGWAAGDRVTSETYFYTCGRCIQCRRGRPNLCKERRSIGSREDGAFARFIRVPATNLHRVADELSLESASLTEPLACVVHGVTDVAQVRAGDRVAIAGPGPIGLLALQLALSGGATVVMLGAGGDAGRLDAALSLGASGALDVTETDNVHDATADLLGDEPDLVIECSGAGAAAPMLLDVVARGGRYCQMGLFGREVSLDLDTVCYKELTLTGTNATVPTAWPRALRLLETGQIQTSPLITHRFALSEWEDALLAARSKAGIKVSLRPSD